MSETPQEDYVPVASPEDDPDYSPPLHDSEEFLNAPDPLGELEDGE